VVLYRLTTPSDLGPWRAVVLDTQAGPPAARALEELLGAWYAMVWQHNQLVPARKPELLVTKENWREFWLAVTPREWYRTSAWINKREACPEAFVWAPGSLDEIELDRWKHRPDRR
jgi:hypothetical protein